MAENGERLAQLPEQDLAGKVALVTGSSRGIGRAIALQLARRGCSLLCTCSGPSSLPKLDSLAEVISAKYKFSQHAAPKIVGVAADIYSAKTPAEIADCVQPNFDGKINIFINNAAKMELKKPGNLSEDFVSEFLRGNVQFPIAVVEEFINRKMFQKESRIICISSERARKVSHFA
jgi:NAD(P)-dependent dehydrogenase (short-subunit alcohol dehydrogenase family)